MLGNIIITAGQNLAGGASDVAGVYPLALHAVVTFNYKDGTKTVLLKDIEKIGLGSGLSFFSIFILLTKSSK